MITEWLTSIAPLAERRLAQFTCIYFETSTIFTPKRDSICGLNHQLNNTFNTFNIVLIQLSPRFCGVILNDQFGVGSTKAATFLQRQPSQAQRLKSRNRWQL